MPPTMREPIEEIVSEPEPRKGRFHFDVWHGIHLKNPFWMVAFFLIGITAAAGHHAYYMSLDHDRVGSESQQQWSLRFGAAFAHMTQVALVASVGVAYTQWLWRTLSRTDISIDCLDAAFDADMAIISLLNKELVRKVKVGAFLALICWCLQLPSLITPATLTVLPTIRTTNENAEVRWLNMHKVDQAKRFTVSTTNPDTDNLLFLGPRTVVSRLVTATATEGLILPIDAPFPNSTYTVNFYGPAIHCEDANSTVVSIIESLRREAQNNHTGDIEPLVNYYYGFVPDMQNIDFSAPDRGVKAVTQTRLQQPTDGSNELWMYYARWLPNQERLPVDERVYEDIFTTCKLYNASYVVDLSFQEIVQNVTISKRELLNAVDYPQRDSPQIDETFVQHAYSAVMWAISNLLVGEMGTFKTIDPSLGGNATFSEIKTQISHTSLLGTSDLRVFFDKNRDLFSKDAKPSDQTVEDQRLAQNRPLDVLIEELGTNVTMSFMNSKLLSPPVNTTIVVDRSINTYAYSSRNLFISYGLAILFALIANILGAIAFLKNGASHSRAFSAKVLTRKGEKLFEIVKDAKSLRAPLSDELKEMRVKFCMDTWEFKKVEIPKHKEKVVTGKRLRRKSAITITEAEVQGGV